MSCLTCLFIFLCLPQNPVQCFSRTERCWRYWQQSALFSSSGRACFLQGKEVSSQKDRHHKVSGPVAETGKQFLYFSRPFSSFITMHTILYEPDPGKKYYSQTGKTINIRNILECYCPAREKPIRHEKIKQQARTLVSLWPVHVSWSLLW